MTLFGWGLLIAAVLVFGIVVLKKYWPSYKDDNPVEEAAEEILKDTTGVDVDLTPGSPDTKQDPPAQK